MLRPFALVVRHCADYVFAVGLAMISGVIFCDTPWKAMLGKDEREATEEEIVGLEAEHGPFQSPDAEG